MFKYLLLACFSALFLAAAFGQAKAAYIPFPQVCALSATVSPSTATDTQIVALSSGKIIYICDIEFSSNAGTTSAADTFYLEQGTSASCGGTLTQLGNTWYVQQFSSKSLSFPYLNGLATGSGDDLCVHTTGTTVALSITVFYAQQ